MAAREVESRARADGTASRLEALALVRVVAITADKLAVLNAQTELGGLLAALRANMGGGIYAQARADRNREPSHRKADRRAW